MAKILLDPGHGRNQNMGVNKTYYEGNAMFALAGYLKAELEKYPGIQVDITRSSATQNPTVDVRGKRAATGGYDMFLSLHTDAHTYGSAACGASIYRSVKLPGSVDFLSQLGNAIVSVLRPHTGNTYMRGVLTRKLANGNDYYGVVRGSVGYAGTKLKISALIEHAFHTNTAECAALSKDSVLRELAVAEAAVIAKYYGVTVTAGGSANAGNSGGSSAGSGAIAVGSVVNFAGGSHYASSTALTPARSNLKAGPAKVTRHIPGAKHPYHVVSTNSASAVHGWVDASSIGASGAAASPQMRAGATVQYSGYLYRDSLGNGRGNKVSGKYTVARHLPGRKCGVLLGVLGWVSEKDCKVLS